MKYCSHCGKQVEDEAVVCVACGCSVEGNSFNKGVKKFGHTCTSCGSPMELKVKKAKMSTGVCVLLLLLFLPAGVIALILGWNKETQEFVCPNCGFKENA